MVEPKNSLITVNEAEKISLLTVNEAEKILFSELRDFGAELVPIEKSIGRTLTQPLIADRDFPPFDRVTMDGIAIKYSAFKAGIRHFKIQSQQSAGESCITLLADNECIEVMTGAILPKNTDTIIRYEDLSISNNEAFVNIGVKPNQNVHYQGEDQKKGATIVPKNTILRPTEIAIAATIGATEIWVKKLPKIVIISSGDEIVPINQKPEKHQIRSSNTYAITSILNNYKIKSDKIHISDQLTITQNTIEKALDNYDILILSGGVSMGKKDFIPIALENLGVQKLFHKIAQTPGKPFWFGKKGEKLVFALPGNPVSTYLCMIRYMIPWHFKSLELNILEPEYAQISEDFSIKNSLTYFLQVKLFNDKSILKAKPIKGHGSGDFANMVNADGFLELPAFERNSFKQGEVFKVWRF